MAKISPGEFAQQVRQEVAKVTWPTRKETMITTAMVFVMVILAVASSSWSTTSSSAGRSTRSSGSED